MLAYFLRHGETDFNAERIISGHSDVSLNETGLAQAREIVVPEMCTYIVSSDLLRCRQTTEIVNNRNLPVRYDPRFREKGYGSLEGKYWLEVDPDERIWATLKTHTYDFRPYGGESAGDVTKRIKEALLDLRTEALERGTPLVVTSSGIIRLLHTLLGEGKDIVENGSIHAFELPDRFVV